MVLVMAIPAQGQEDEDGSPKVDNIIFLPGTIPGSMGYGACYVCFQENRHVQKT